MRLAFLYGPWCIGSRTIDFDNLEASSRGLTGSELSCIQIALAMKARGHQVALFTAPHGPQPPCRAWQHNGVEIEVGDYPTYISRVQTNHYDAVCSWNEPDLLGAAPEGTVRYLNQQLNDFQYCPPYWENFVDVGTSPSAHHLGYIKQFITNKERWEVLPNGCDPDQYVRSPVPGRVLWASSADRGLHLLLSVWPQIKARVPHATLRCFYNFAYEAIEDLEETGPLVQQDLLEIAQRVRYIKYALEKLKGQGVTHEGSVSRDRMRQEMGEAVVLGYPCDTIRYTEGFSVTTMEACAAGVLPVISEVDSLKYIYGGAVPMVKAPARQHLDEFVDLVVRGLTDETWRKDMTGGTVTWARQHTWGILAEKLEGILGRAADKKRKVAA
jgi:glycosyltransferase involved in cell wall biosynthesis